MNPSAPGLEAVPLRLLPGADLRRALEDALAPRGCTAAFALSGIGSLGGAAVRFAGAKDVQAISGDLEILTLAGSISRNGAHLHISVADAHGHVHGGHVAYGCTVRTTAEVLLLLLRDFTFTREPDPATGFAELVIRDAS